MVLISISSYGVSALIGLKESEPTSWYEIPVPPRFGSSELPHLVIEKVANGSVTFAMKNNEKNHRCKVRNFFYYKISH